MEILHLLYEVNRFKIFSLLILQQGDLSEEEIEFVCVLLPENQIRKICFENMKDADEL